MRSAWKVSARITTTGISMATRNILARVAASPTSGEMIKPAPTTWATSWMEPPRNNPASAVVRPKFLTING
ncbi:hypothetical protein D3C72_2222320 [compost metagenome]